jgi:hypothetical protein
MRQFASSPSSKIFFRKYLKTNSLDFEIRIRLAASAVQRLSHGRVNRSLHSIVHSGVKLLQNLDFRNISTSGMVVATQESNPPSFLESVQCPGDSRGAGPRREDGTSDNMIRASLHSALVLLIAAAQLVAARGAPSPGGNASNARYFCCCVGECHCTADCCNHAPTAAADHESSRIRVGAGSPIMEAPRQCGVWQGTLQRSPQQGKLLLADIRGGARLGSEESFRIPLPLAVTASDDRHLRPSSPRAPPT